MSLADRWCRLEEIQAYPAQTAPVGLALQQRAIGVLMQKEALFGPGNIHLKGQRAQILFALYRHQYPLFYCVWHHSWANNRGRKGQTVMRWIKHLMTWSCVKTRWRVWVSTGAWNCSFCFHCQWTDSRVAPSSLLRQEKAAAVVRGWEQAFSDQQK